MVFCSFHAAQGQQESRPLKDTVKSGGTPIFTPHVLTPGKNIRRRLNRGLAGEDHHLFAALCFSLSSVLDPIVSKSSRDSTMSDPSIVGNYRKISPSISLSLKTNLEHD